MDTSLNEMFHAIREKYCRDSTEHNDCLGFTFSGN